MHFFSKALALVSCLLWLAFSPSLQAQSLLRDAELEAFFREISDPIFVKAGLTPASVKMYLIADNSLNAFVTGGQNIFIHTGLIMSADHVDQLTGVIAHETCHIACGHRIRSNDAASTISGISILSMVLGAAAIAAGSGDAGLGLLLGGQTSAQFQYLAYSRGQEAEADISAARYLESVGVSSKGLIEFFDKLRDQEILASIRQDPYIRTHPLNRQRILNLQRLGEKSIYYDQAPNPQHQEKFERIKAKLAGYMLNPVHSLNQYPESDQSIKARYARVYAYHKALEWDKALAEADQLIALEPNNPYFYEIKGQILFENHRLIEAEKTFEKAIELVPNQPLILTAYAQALVSQDKDEKMQQAIPILKRAVQAESDNSFAWYNLARAYSWLENEPMANLATAERFYSVGQGPQAIAHAKRVQKHFKTGSREWIRAEDIITATEFYLSQRKR